MNFKKVDIKDFYLLTTEVENLFINEVLPEAPGDYVKVYLYALMSAENQPELTNERLAQILKLPEDTVLSAWNYFQEAGLIRKKPNNKPGKFNFDIEFVSQRDLLYGNIDKDANFVSFTHEEETSDTFYDGEAYREVIAFVEETTGRMLSAKDLKEITSWIDDLGATVDVIEAATTYCTEHMKTNVNYIAKVVMQWTEDGYRTKEDVENHLKTIGERQTCYKRIIQSLGLNRAATSAEKRMIDVWMDEWRYNLDRILEACDKTISTANPNLNYVNKVLENWKKDAAELGRDVNNKLTVNQQVLNSFYEHLREEAKEKARARLEEVYIKLPRIKELDCELKELGTELSMGVLKGLSKEERERLKNAIQKNEAERGALLTENNFALDYTDVKFRCEKCGDTGIDEDGQRCTCVKQRIGEAELWQQSQK